MKLDTPVRSDAVRFVSMACIHHSLPDPKSIPPGDVLIVAGDFTQCGRLDEIELFSNYLKQLSHTFKVIIAGNHECTFDNRLTKITENTRKKESLIKQTFPPQKKSVAKEKLQNGIYLEDSLVELFGIQIYGHGDVLPSGLHIGCVELLNSVVKRIRPKYHVFAHIHAGYGCTTDGYTKFINCSLVDDRLQPVNNPIIFDLPIAVDVKEYWLQHYRQSVV
ncbi:unnamed protein product [Thelazia callipaeda]|uniref:Metallophos domain-containing protein n=1 Tax=Thelazia callipaeda TaxID=103827 RepID=A0A0N5CZT9_THECL|nr:unnamed protein product [Thelazia callipaeda]